MDDSSTRPRSPNLLLTSLFLNLGVIPQQLSTYYLFNVYLLIIFGFDTVWTGHWRGAGAGTPGRSSFPPSGHPQKSTTHLTMNRKSMKTRQAERWMNSPDRRPVRT